MPRHWKGKVEAIPNSKFQGFLTVFFKNGAPGQSTPCNLSPVSLILMIDLSPFRIKHGKKNYQCSLFSVARSALCTTGEVFTICATNLRSALGIFNFWLYSTTKYFLLQCTEPYYPHPYISLRQPCAIYKSVIVANLDTYWQLTNGWAYFLYRLSSFSSF